MAAAAGDGEEAKPAQQPEQQPAETKSGSAYGGGVMAKLEEQWRKTKEHAETYPYVWGSYILVYGGLAAYLTWRWTKLRRTEDRVRGLQARLRQIEERQAASSPPPPSEQPPLAEPGNPTSGP